MFLIIPYVAREKQTINFIFKKKEFYKNNRSVEVDVLLVKSDDLSSNISASSLDDQTLNQFLNENQWDIEILSSIDINPFNAPQYYSLEIPVNISECFLIIKYRDRKFFKTIKLKEIIFKAIRDHEENPEVYVTFTQSDVNL